MSRFDPDQELQLRSIAEAVSVKTVEQMLVRLGIDHQRPIEAQKDLAALREIRMLLTDGEFQKDMTHLRQWRRAMESATSKGFLALTGMLFLGGVGFILYSLGYRPN